MKNKFYSILALGVACLFGIGGAVMIGTNASKEGKYLEVHADDHSHRVIHSAAVFTDEGGIQFSFLPYGFQNDRAGSGADRLFRIGSSVTDQSGAVSDPFQVQHFRLNGHSFRCEGHPVSGLCVSRRHRVSWHLTRIPQRHDASEGIVPKSRKAIAETGGCGKNAGSADRRIKFGAHPGCVPFFR